MQQEIQFFSKNFRNFFAIILKTFLRNKKSFKSISFAGVDFFFTKNCRKKCGVNNFANFVLVFFRRFQIQKYNFLTNVPSSISSKVLEPSLTGLKFFILRQKIFCWFDFAVAVRSRWKSNKKYHSYTFANTSVIIIFIPNQTDPQNLFVQSF